MSASYTDKDKADGLRAPGSSDPKKLFLVFGVIAAILGAVAWVAFG